MSYNEDFFNAFTKSQEAMWDAWKDMYKNFSPLKQEDEEKKTNTFMDMMMGPMKGFYGSYRGNPMEVWQRMSQSSDMYYKLYEVYRDMVEKNVKPMGDEVKKAIDQWMEKSGQALTDLYLPLLPPDLAQVVEQGMDLGKTYQSTMNYFLGPWMDNMLPLQDAIAKGLFKDPQGYMDFFKEWEKDYKDTISKVLDMPMMGINRAAQEDVLQTANRYIQMVSYQFQVVGRILQLAYTNTIEAFEKQVAAYEEGQEIKSFEDFYEEWRESLGHSFDDLFYSDEFSKLLAMSMESFMDFKMAMDKVLEKQLAGLPLVLKSDINSLYKTVYDLKKEVRSLKKQLEEKEAPKTEAPKTEE